MSPIFRYYKRFSQPYVRTVSGWPRLDTGCIIKIERRIFCNSPLMTKLEEQDSRRGLLIDNKLQLLGAKGSIFAIGDCTFHPGLFPTAQVAHQEGEYLAQYFKKAYKIDQLNWKMTHAKDDSEVARLKNQIVKTQSQIEDFKYNHKGALAYIGSDKAIADLAVGEAKYRLAGSFTFLFWKSAYLAMCLSLETEFLLLWIGLKFIFWVEIHLSSRNRYKRITFSSQYIIQPKTVETMLWLQIVNNYVLLAKSSNRRRIGPTHRSLAI